MTGRVRAHVGVAGGTEYVVREDVETDRRTLSVRKPQQCRSWSRPIPLAEASTPELLARWSDGEGLPGADPVIPATAPVLGPAVVPTYVPGDVETAGEDVDITDPGAEADEIAQGERARTRHPHRRAMTLRMPAALWRQVKIAAVEAEVPASALIRQALEDYLAAHRDQDHREPHQRAS